MFRGGPREKSAPVMPPAPEAAGEEEAPPLDPKVRRARILAGAVLFAVGAAEFASAVFTREIVIAAIWATFGFVALATGLYLYRGRFTAWGTAIIVNTFSLLLALATIDLYVAAALIASFVVLYLFRLPFGVGAWKIESAKENERTRALIEERTRKASGMTCPKCGARTLWLADDGSAFCLTCRAGTIELARREPS
ncbi:MAG: hypothetical protein E6K10_03490 [Methanobacteriota archaeon]|nr:MAG: hypothetical protein E6K10_03490 [Euryarchaeota archaeon]